MRKINEIIVHCSATPEGRHVDVNTIRQWHKKRGWSDIGYHYVVYLDGSVHEGRPIEKVGAHVKGRNTGTIGVCYVGGVEKDGKTPKDTRTKAQKDALETLLLKLRDKFNVKKISGHNQYAAKACPSFDAGKEYAKLLNGYAGPAPAQVDERIQWLQKLLVRRGYDLGQTDGIIGNKTIRAINNFQKDYGLEVTGTFNVETVKTLRDGIPQEITPEVEKVIQDADKPLTSSKTAISSSILGTGAVATVATQAKEAVENVKTTTEAVIAIGPWAIALIAAGGLAFYIIRERKRKQVEAKQAKKSLEE